MYSQHSGPLFLQIWRGVRSTNHPSYLPPFISFFKPLLTPHWLAVLARYWSLLWAIVMGFLPYCEDGAWVCFKGVVLGSFSFIICGLCMYAFRRIVPVWVTTRWYTDNLVMLSLAFLQAFFLTINFFLYKNPKLEFTVRLVHGWQVILTCTVYGKLACESLHKPKLFYWAVVPLTCLLLIWLLVCFFFNLASDEDCQHPTWLWSSVTGATVAVSFAVTGSRVLKVIESAAGVQAKYSDLFSGGQQFLLQKHKQLWLVMMMNAISSVVNVVLDFYTSSLEQEEGDVAFNCALFTEDNYALEELVQIVLTTVGTMAPNMVLWYVFFWLQRAQFMTHLDMELDGHESALRLGDAGGFDDIGAGDIAYRGLAGRGRGDSADDPVSEYYI